MGLILSIFAPNLLQIENEGARESSEMRVSKMEAAAPVFADNSEIKYLSKRGPPTVLGPTPGNVAAAENPIAGLPVIHPPKDTTTKVAENSSVYDTLAMTPDVDWSKKNDNK